MVSCKTKITEFEPETFELIKTFDTCIYVRLFTKTHITVFRSKHHSHPVISCVTSWFFIASATYIFHNFYVSCCVVSGQTFGLPHATEKINVKNMKKLDGFSSAGPTLSFQSAQYSQPNSK